VRIGSAGKSFSVTGWKVGYVSAAPALLAPILRAHQYVTFTTPPALQAAVAVGLRFPDSYFLGLKAELQARRDSLRASLQQAGFQAPPVAATYFATVDISALDPGGDDLAFCQRLVREAGVAAIPVSGFYQSRDIKTHIRFCFAKPAPLLAEAARRLADWRAANPSDARTRTEDQPRRGAATGVSP